MRTPKYRSFVPILVAFTLLALLAPSAQAASWLSSPFDGIWGWLSNLWAETGGVADPHGGCRSSSTPPILANGGCVIDPNGGCGNVGQ